VNGKVRTEILVSKDDTEEMIKNIVLSNDVVKNWINGKEIKRFIFVPGRLVNVVI
jgi:leucyl-tRNA synthetase